MSASHIAHRLSKRNSKKTRAELLAEALRDWRSGRAFVGDSGHTYYLKPIHISHINDRVVITRGGRPTVAPWSKIANEEWGSGPDSSKGLHDAAHARYPDGSRSDFERMHAMDPVANELLQKMRGEVL